MIHKFKSSKLIDTKLVVSKSYAIRYYATT